MMLDKSRWFGLVVLLLVGAMAQAEPTKKKPTFPPPEESSTVGVLGAHHDSAARSAGLASAPPPAPIAAPEVPKVETEAPSSLPAAPRYEVRPDSAANSGMRDGVSPVVAPNVAMQPSSGYLVEHPLISGLVAGLIGTDFGARLYGGAMMGDETAAMIGYGLRIAVILLLALMLFRWIGRRAANPGGGRLTPPSDRREPGFGAAPPTTDGRREPTFGRGEG